MLRVERAHLQRLEPQRETWAKLLQPRRDALLLPFTLLLENIAVVAKENEIALVSQYSASREAAAQNAP